MNTTKTIDSNVTSLYIAEEDDLKILPSNPVWHGIEVNSYSDFGGSTTLLQRETINPSRQNQKGKIVDIDASAGFSLDMTKNIFPWLMRGFMFAEAREKFTTQSLSGKTLPIKSVSKGYNFPDSHKLPQKLLTGTIIHASGFSNFANNGLKIVYSCSDNNISTNSSTPQIEELNPPASAKISAVGFKFSSGSCSMEVKKGTLPKLVSTSTDLTKLGLIEGEWIWVGGDASDSYFPKNRGWARITEITAKTITFDDTDFVPENDTGANIKLEIYFGTVIKNEKEQNKIVKKTYCFERTLGSVNNEIQAQYVNGAVANELTINMGSAQYVTADLNYVGCNSFTKKGKNRIIGERLECDKSSPFNATSNIYRQKLSINDTKSSTPSALFAYVTDSSLAISNGVTGVKGLGILGSFDVSVGNFSVTGSITAYFSSVDAIEAIRNNADVGFSTILAAENSGVIFDIPLLALSGGMPNIEKDQKITIPLEKTGAENKHGYTMMYQTFEYLPDSAMPYVNV